MSAHYLSHTFDIHGGGMDLIFPHHENEIAQSCAACPDSNINFWVHNGFVNVDDLKMSKSLGNFFTIREVKCEIAFVYFSPLSYFFFSNIWCITEVLSWQQLLCFRILFSMFCRLPNCTIPLP